MKKGFRVLLGTVLSVIACLSLFTKLELYQGMGENVLLTVCNRLYNTFVSNSFSELVLVASFVVLFVTVLNRAEKFSVITFVFSVLFAFLYLISAYYEKYDSTYYMYANSYQIIMTFVLMVGYSSVIYVLLTGISLLEEKFNVSSRRHNGFFYKNFFGISALFIFVCWLSWILVNYPGSTNPDTIVQLQNFLGDTNWSSWQPPFSSALIGGLFYIGRALVDANFGIFLYCLFQTVTGSLVVAYAINKLKENGVSFTYCVGSTVFFGTYALWGSYAQWCEKDFLFAQGILLFHVLVIDIYVKKDFTVKRLVALTATAIVTCLLRNNGIYAILPGMLALGLYMLRNKGVKILLSMLITLLVYEGVTKGLYPALNIEKGSVAETYGVLFQQTARYVVTYPQDVTSEEKAILDANFQDMDNLTNYDPRIIDPVKIFYNNADFKGYLKVWKAQFLRHPGVYFEATLNNSYGYLAPISTDIGAWVQEDMYDYLAGLGAYHPYNGVATKIYIWLWNLAMQIPVIRYLSMPGFYTWLILGLVLKSILKKKGSDVILLIPSLITILVCVASPLSDAMRYELPVTIVAPVLLGYMMFNRRKDA